MTCWIAGVQIIGVFSQEFLKIFWWDQKDVDDFSNYKSSNCMSFTVFPKSDQTAYFDSLFYELLAAFSQL